MATILEPRQGWIQLRGLELHYLEWGSREAPPLVLDHGLQDCASCWDFLASRLAAEWRVLALDHRGHGDSPWAGPDDYRVADTLGELTTFTSALGLDRPPIIGHSAGGRHAMLLAATAPSHAGPIVVIDIYPDPANAASTEMFRRYLSQDDRWPSLEAVFEELRIRRPRAGEELLRHHAEVLTRPGDGGHRSWKRDRNALLAYERTDCWPYLPNIRVPALIIRGTESGILPPDTAERMCRAIPRAREPVALEGGHWCHEEDPDTFYNALAGFLREVTK